MKPDLVMVGPMMPHVMEALDQAFAMHRYWEANDKAALLAEVGPRVRAIATDGGLGASAEMMAAMPGLEIVSCYGVGYDAIDIGYAREHDVIVTNTPGVLNDCVADLALALMLAVFRRIPQADRYVRGGKWLQANHPLCRKFSGTKLGIIGLGRIGKTIARRAEAFDVEISYHGRHEQPDQPYRYYADLVEMARDVDTLCVITPGGAATRHMVNRAVMEALGPDGVLINVARGSVVDEAALVACLESGALGGAGLDVFEAEPQVPEALFAMDNVVLQPHMGSATHETRRAMGDLVVDNLAAHFAGKPALTPVA